jgi:hypothetical protein
MNISVGAFQKKGYIINFVRRKIKSLDFAELLECKIYFAELLECKIYFAELLECKTYFAELLECKIYFARLLECKIYFAMTLFLGMRPYQFVLPSLALRQMNMFC